MRVLIAGGGTGGHYFPALAVGEELLKRGFTPFYVGSKGGIEGRLGFPPAKESLYLSHSSLRGRGALSVLRAPSYGASLVKVLSFVKRVKPEAVLIFGGYSSLPAGLAAALFRIPLLIQEQNSIPGKTNRYLSRAAREGYLGFSSAKEYLACPSIFTGNPLRKEIVETAKNLTEEKKREFKERLGLEPDLKTLLIVGGSQGALWINRLVERAISGLPEGIQVIHVTGRGKEGRLRELYAGRGIKALVLPFYERIWELYGAADGAVSRAGALAMSELSAFRIPTLYIPYPYAADNHQLENALYLSKRGGALVYTQEELSVELFLQSLEALLFDIIGRERMRGVMAELFPLNATQRVASEIEKWIEKRS